MLSFLLSHIQDHYEILKIDIFIENLKKPLIILTYKLPLRLAF